MNNKKKKKKRKRKEEKRRTREFAVQCARAAVLRRRN